MPKSVINISPLGFPWKTQDPFLFCVYHADDYPKGNEQLGPAASLAGRPGFPAHPHRGFETVTIVRKGMVDHSDSLGATARFGDGDVQWLTSGKGLQHAEMFPLLKQEEKNPLELFQLWLNLPKASKFVEPHFKMLWGETIPKINLQDAAGRNIDIELTAGTLNDIIAPDPTPDSWAAKRENEVLICTIQLEAHAEWTMPIATEGITRSLYFYEGDQIHIEGYDIAPNHCIELNAKEATKIKNGAKKGHLFLLQGRPIQEPVVQHGPFVMN